MIAHLIYCPFTGLGKIDRGDEWLKNRIRIFKDFVVPSLSNQETLQYTLWISWRPEDKTNPIVEDFYNFLLLIQGLTVIFTYEGLCFWDDKYSEAEAKEKLLTNLRRTLPYLKQHTDYADEVYMTIQPSDDIYFLDTFSRIQKEDFGNNKVLGYKKGYIADLHRKKLAEYNPDTCPPFFTIRFPKDIFLDEKKHMEWATYKSHEYAKDLGFKELEGRGFIVGTHGENISTVWNLPYKGRELSEEEAEKVWISTGNYFTEPLKIKPSRSLLLRKIYNTLPFKKVIKKIYYAIR